MTREDALFRALLEIARWPDNGTRYGQKHIKRYAHEQLTFAAGLVGNEEHQPVPMAHDEGEAA